MQVAVSWRPSPCFCTTGSRVTEARVSILFFRLLRLLTNGPVRHVSYSADGKMKSPRWFWDGQWHSQGPKYKESMCWPSTLQSAART